MLDPSHPIGNDHLGLEAKPALSAFPPGHGPADTQKSALKGNHIAFCREVGAVNQRARCRDIPHSNGPRSLVRDEGRGQKHV
jgi:hypothetical protein